MSSVMHKVKDAFSGHKDDNTSSSDTTDTNSTNTSDMNQQRSTGPMDTGDPYSSTHDSRFATAGQTGHGMAGSGPEYNSATAPNTGAPQAHGGVERMDFGAGTQPTQGYGTTTHHTSQMSSNDPNFGGSKNPRDAAHVPPSVLTRHVGEREVPEGDDSFTDHARRHSLKTGDSLQQYGSGST